MIASLGRHIPLAAPLIHPTEVLHYSVVWHGNSSGHLSLQQERHSVVVLQRSGMYDTHCRTTWLDKIEELSGDIDAKTI